MTAVSRVALALLLALSGLVVTAGPAAAEVQLSVEVGVDGRFATGLPMPVRVRVEADRLISGHLAISSFAEAEIVQTIDVDLAAGSTKEFVAIMPTSVGNAPQIEVQLLDGDTVIAQARSVGRFATGDELVGLLPELERATDAPTSASLAIGTDTAQITAVPRSLLLAGSAALAPYDQILGLPSDLTALGEDGRAVVLGWVAAGGTLLIDADDETAPTGLADELWPAGDAPVRLGAGTIQLTAGAAASGASWSAILWPTPARSIFDGNVVWEGFEGGGFFDPSQALAQDAGFRLPDVGALLVLLAIYIVLVGPVMYRVLKRRGRRTLTWVAVPLASVLFSVIFFVQGRDLRSGASNAHITVYEQTDQGTVAMTATMLSSRNGATASLEAPAGWYPWPWLDTMIFGGFGPFGPTTTPMAIDPDGTTAEVELDPGAYRVIEARGAVDAALLDVRASSASSGDVEVVITNTSPVALREVVAVVARQTVDVDDLAPGATRTITIEHVADRRPDERREGGLFGDSINPFDGGFDGVLGGEVVFDDFGNPVMPSGELDGPIAPGVWSRYADDKGTNLFAPGRVMVAAWSDELPAPVLRDGNPIPAGRSLIVRSTEIDAADSMLTDASASLELVRGGDDPFGMGFEARPRDDRPGDDDDLDVLPRDDAFIRLLLPRQSDGSAVDRGQLVLDLPSDLSQAHLWQDGEWIELFVGLGERRRLRLSPDAATNGALWLRIGSSWVVDPQRDDPKRERTVVLYDIESEPTSEDDADDEVEIVTMEYLATLAERFAAIRAEAAEDDAPGTTTEASP